MSTKPNTKKSSGVAVAARRASAKVATRRPTKPVASAEESSVRSMRVYGTTPADFLAISSTATTLMCGIGEDSDKLKVLVPYLKLRFKKPDNLDGDLEETTYSSAFEGTLAYENVAYLLMDLARDLRGATRQLEDMSSGTLKPEMSRLKYSSDCVKSARASLETVLSLLEELTSPAAAPAKPSGPRLRTARPNAATPK